MSVCWLLIGDGRDSYHERSLASAREMLPAPDQVVTVDDSDHTLGFAGAIAAGWGQIVAATHRPDWVVHLELDFVFRRPVPIGRIVSVLERRPNLAQVCLKRQPVNETEIAAGGIIESRPDDYRQVVDRGDIFCEHRVCFSTNPCVYPSALCHQGWPQEPHSEGVFTHRLLSDPDCRFALWGAKGDPPMVEHIGTVRAGNGY